MEDTVTRGIADRVRQLRAERGWSARRLADECARAGLSTLTRGTIAKIESGVRKSVTAEELTVLARVLGVTPTELTAPEVTEPSGPWKAAHNTILAVDVEGFTQSGVDSLAVREGLYTTLKRAFEEAGIPWDVIRQEDRGDGALILAPADVSKSKFVDQLPQRLQAGLRRHNLSHPEQAQIRIRVALHAGEVHVGDAGAVGSSLVLTFRLLDSKAVREALQATQGTLAVIASDWMYDEVIRHDPAALAELYRPVEVSAKETRARAWVRVVDAATASLPDDAGLDHEDGPSVAFLVVQIEVDPLDRDTYIVRPWRHLGSGWAPELGTEFRGNLTEIQAQVADLVTEAETGWAANADDIRLEFMLPRQLLDLPVERWLNGDDDLPQPLGLRYPVTVRSLERMRSQRWHREWRRRWRAARTTSARSTLWINSQSDPRKILADLVADNKTVAMAIDDQLPEFDGFSADPVSVGLMSGVPILIWHRGGDVSPAFAKTVRDILADGVDHLPERVRALRGEAFAAADPEAHIGSSLALMWDNPERRLVVYDLPLPPKSAQTTDEVPALGQAQDRRADADTGATPTPPQ